LPIEFYVNGLPLHDGVVVEIPVRTGEYVHLKLDIHNAGEVSIKKGGLQVYVGASNFTYIDENILDSVPMDLQRTTSPEGNDLYRLLDFPPLLAGSWESKNIGFGRHQADLKPGQLYEVILVAATSVGKRRISFKIKLVP
jgi:hypothetical protein